MDTHLLDKWKKISDSTIQSLEKDIEEIQNILSQNISAPELSYMKSMLENSLPLLISKKNDYIYMANQILQNPTSNWSITMMNCAIQNSQ